METTAVYWGYVGIMEMQVEATISYGLLQPDAGMRENTSPHIGRGDLSSSSRDFRRDLYLGPLIPLPYITVTYVVII